MIRIFLRIGENRLLQGFAGETIRIGRAPMNHLVICDPRVSRLHARIERAEDGIQVIDLKSGNGTRVNGEKIESERLRVGDALQIGPTRLRVVEIDVSGPAVAPTPSSRRKTRRLQLV